MQLAQLLTSFVLSLAFTSQVALADECFNRETSPHTLQVDSHLHVHPFGSPAIPFPELITILKKSGVKYASAYGLGQPFSVKTTCKYYLDCPGVPTRPSWINDFKNQKSIQKHKQDEVKMYLSMSFPDLANPEGILDKLIYVENEYPKQFTWVGEVNLIKHALLKNAHEPATKSDINHWQPFMKYLREKNLPITIHADIGINDDPFKYLHLMRHALELYPNNKIIWAHMGLSKEQNRLSTRSHISLINSLLRNHKNCELTAA